jgi:peptidoglycan/LPS O-acetylase OafA/YrhL
MDGRRARLIGPVLDGVPRLTRPGRTSTRAAEGQLETRWAMLLGVGWPLVMALAIAIEPAPADPDTTPLVLDVLAEFSGLVMLGALVVTAVSAAARQRSAAVAGVVVGAVAVGLSVTCPLSGHHGFGLWWVAQLGMLTAMLGASVAALGRRATTSA